MTKTKQASGKYIDYDYTPHLENYDIITKIKLPKKRIKELIRMELRKLEDEHKKRMSEITDNYLRKLVEFGYNKAKKEGVLHE